MQPLKKPRPHSRDHRNPNGHSLLLEDCKIWSESGLVSGSILIADGKIERIGKRFPRGNSESLSCNGLTALPGMIDAHVHLRGMDLSYKEDFQSGTSAAIAGGVTTVLDMPNTRPITDSPQRLVEKFESARNKILANVGFHVAATNDRQSVREMARLGAFSMKLYMPKPISPIDVDDDNVLLRLLKLCRSNDLPLTVHAEERRLIEDSGRPRTFLQLASRRPESAEKVAVGRMISLAKKARARVHFCHLTLPSSIRLVNSEARFTTSEVTPHHMLLDQGFMVRNGWKSWMVPPLRRSGVVREMFQMVSKGEVTMLASDHAPHKAKEKSGAVHQSPPGVPGLETILPLMLTQLNRGRLTLSRLVRLYSTNPAKVFGLGRKGRIQRGFDADIVLVDTKKRQRVNAEKFYSKAHYSPFEGMITKGSVEATIVSGKLVFHEGQVIGEPGDGTLLKPGVSH